jgi:hypothetical protein
LRGEFVALEVGRQFPLAIDHNRMQRVSQLAIFGPYIHAEPEANGPHLLQGPGEEMPGLRIGFPDSRLFCENIRLIVNRIERDTEEHQILTHAGSKPFPYLPKIIG